MCEGEREREREDITEESYHKTERKKLVRWWGGREEGGGESGWEVHWKRLVKTREWRRGIEGIKGGEKGEADLERKEKKPDKRNHWKNKEIRKGEKRVGKENCLLLLSLRDHSRPSTFRIFIGEKKEKSRFTYEKKRWMSECVCVSVMEQRIGHLQL